MLLPRICRTLSVISPFSANADHFAWNSTTVWDIPPPLVDGDRQGFSATTAKHRMTWLKAEQRDKEIEMSEMVERVARAMATANGYDPDQYATEDLKRRHPDLEWPRNWEVFVVNARVAIEAMRKPTTTMWKCGERPPGSPRSYDAHAVWGAMIDAALLESPEK